MGKRRRGRPRQRYRLFRQRFPEASFWLIAGLGPKAALALARAGYRSLTDLEGALWEQLRAIPGVGLASLELIEALLGRPLPREGKKRRAAPAAPWPEHLWRKRGVTPEAALTFAQMGMTLERLKSMAREELLGLPGVGLATVQACELLIGRAIPRRIPADPGEVFWRGHGLPSRAARALSRAGLRTPEDLGAGYREALLALRGFGPTALSRLEEIRGSVIPGRTAYWRERGLTEPLAEALLQQGISTVEALGALTREQFLALPGLGYGALGRCEKLLGRRFPRWRGSRDEGE